MSGEIEARLSELKISLPTPISSIASYVPYVYSGNILMLSGQLSITDEENHFTGKLGESMTIDEGYWAARQCGLNLIAQMKSACNGNLDKVKGILRLCGYVNSTPDFLDHPNVINGASDLMIEVFGDIGQHSRIAIGSCSLPLGVAVEVDAIIEIS